MPRTTKRQPQYKFFNLYAEKTRYRPGRHRPRVSSVLISSELSSFRFDPNGRNDFIRCCTPPERFSIQPLPWLHQLVQVFVRRMCIDHRKWEVKTAKSNYHALTHSLAANAKVGSSRIFAPRHNTHRNIDRWITIAHAM